MIKVKALLSQILDVRILFICTGNSYRSPLAEALIRKHHSNYEVESAGVHPIDKIAEITQDQLEKSDALEYLKPVPDKISQRAMTEADRIVCMMPRHSEFVKRNFDLNPMNIEVWNIEDPNHPDTDYERAFERIEEEVRQIDEG